MATNPLLAQLLAAQQGGLGAVGGGNTVQQQQLMRKARELYVGNIPLGSVRACSRACSRALSREAEGGKSRGVDRRGARKIA